MRQPITSEGLIYEELEPTKMTSYETNKTRVNANIGYGSLGKRNRRADSPYNRPILPDGCEEPMTNIQAVGSGLMIGVTASIMAPVLISVLGGFAALTAAGITFAAVTQGVAEREEERRTNEK